MRLQNVEKIRSNMSINSTKKTSNLLDGLYCSIYKGRSLDFDDLRDYVVGDNNKDIDWKSSIRHGSLLVRRYVALKRHNIVFVLDSGMKMTGLNPGYEEKKETLFYTLGTIGYLVSRNEDEIATIFSKSEKIYMSPFKSGLRNLEGTLEKVSKELEESSQYSINDLLEYLSKNVRRKMIIVIISDIDGLISLDDNVLKKVTFKNDILFININDASIFDEDIYDIDGENDIPRFLASNKKLEEILLKNKEMILEENYRRLRGYRISSVTINNKKEIIDKLIDLLERHNHAVGR